MIDNTNSSYTSYITIEDKDPNTTLFDESSFILNESEDGSIILTLISCNENALVIQADYEEEEDLRSSIASLTYIALTLGLTHFSLSLSEELSRF